MSIVSLSRTNVPYAVGLLKELHALSAYRDIAFEWNKVLDACHHAVDADNWFGLLSVDEQGTYNGIAAGYVTPFFFSSKLMAVETSWFVVEGTVDRTKIGVQLMKSFMSWALDEKGAIHVQTADTALIDSRAVDIMYRRMGFKRAGTIYKYER